MNEKFPEKDIREYSFWKELTQIPSIEAIYIYGSRARGENAPHSDLDIAVLCPEATKADWDKFMEIINNAKLLLHIEVTRLDELTPSLFHTQVHATKSLVYYKPSVNYRHFIPDNIHLTMNLLRDLDKHLANPKPRDPEWLSAVLVTFQRAVFAVLRLLRRTLLLHGMRAEPPVLILRHSLLCQWIEDRALWEAMHEDWQYSSHTCTPPVAREIISRIPDYVAAIHVTLDRVGKLVDNNAKT